MSIPGLKRRLGVPFNLNINVRTDFEGSDMNAKLILALDAAQERGGGTLWIDESYTMTAAPTLSAATASDVTIRGSHRNVTITAGASMARMFFADGATRFGFHDLTIDHNNLVTTAGVEVRGAKSRVSNIVTKNTGGTSSLASAVAAGSGADGSVIENCDSDNVGYGYRFSTGASDLTFRGGVITNYYQKGVLGSGASANAARIRCDAITIRNGKSTAQPLRIEQPLAFVLNDCQITNIIIDDDVEDPADPADRPEGDSQDSLSINGNVHGTVGFCTINRWSDIGINVSVAGNDYVSKNWMIIGNRLRNQYYCGISAGSLSYGYHEDYDTYARDMFFVANLCYDTGQLDDIAASSAPRNFSAFSAWRCFRPVFMNNYGVTTHATLGTPFEATFRDCRKVIYIGNRMPGFSHARILDFAAETSIVQQGNSVQVTIPASGPYTVVVPEATLDFPDGYRATFEVGGAVLTQEGSAGAVNATGEVHYNSATDTFTFHSSDAGKQVRINALTNTSKSTYLALDGHLDVLSETVTVPGSGPYTVTATKISNAYVTAYYAVTGVQLTLAASAGAVAAGQFYHANTPLFTFHSSDAGLDIVLYAGESDPLENYYPDEDAPRGSFTVTVGGKQYQPDGVPTGSDGACSWEPVNGTYTGTATWDPGSIADGDQASTTVTVTGATAFVDLARATFSISRGGLDIDAEVTATDTVTVTFSNHTGSPVDLGSGTVTAYVTKADLA